MTAGDRFAHDTFARDTSVHGTLAKGTATVKELLSEILSGAKTIAVLGCGSELRGDDAAGDEIARLLLNLEAGRGKNTLVLRCGTAPENFTGEIKKFRPDVLLIIDAAAMGLPAGTAALIETEDIGGASFGTHMLALKIMADYLSIETGCRTGILGIQPGSFEFEADLTPPVRQIVDEAVSALNDLLKNEV